MEKFVEDLGFRVADNTTAAIAIGVLAAMVGLFLAYRALRGAEDVREYRVLAVVLGIGLALVVALGLPYAHNQADKACDRWARSADNLDELRYLSHECAKDF